MGKVSFQNEIKGLSERLRIVRVELDAGMDELCNIEGLVYFIKKQTVTEL